MRHTQNKKLLKVKGGVSKVLNDMAKTEWDKWNQEVARIKAVNTPKAKDAKKMIGEVQRQQAEVTSKRAREGAAEKLQAKRNKRDEKFG